MRSPLTPLRLALLVVAVIGLVAAGGAILLADEPAQLRPDVVEDASDQIASLDGFSARQETTVRTGNETRRIDRRVIVRPGTGKYRAVALGNSTGRYDKTVSNGSVTWYYDRDNQTVRRMNIDTERNSPGILLAGSYIERLLQAAAGDSNQTASDISTLPMVSSARQANLSGSLSTNASTFQLNVSYRGIETVSGRETYVLDLTQSANARLANYSGRIWIDTEWFVPLRHRTAFTVDGTRYVTETRYENVSFNPDMDDVSFEFDPPSDANVSVSSEMSFTQYDSREALANNATISIPDPDVPDDFQFQRGARTVGDQRSVTLQYSNGTSSLSITVSNSTSTAAEEGSTVQIGTASGRMQAFGASTLVSWPCQGRSYAVIGSNLGNETVVEVARSLGCDYSSHWKSMHTRPHDGSAVDV
jgi:outer membrane lipoprotein-sorting protein